MLAFTWCVAIVHSIPILQLTMTTTPCYSGLLLSRGRVLMELLEEFPGTYAWISFSCCDGRHISNGELFSDCVSLANQFAQVNLQVIISASLLTMFAQILIRSHNCPGCCRRNKLYCSRFAACMLPSIKKDYSISSLNCLFVVENILGLLKSIPISNSKKLIVYPNSGETWDPNVKLWHMESEAGQKRLKDYVIEWRDAGASIIGGCCRTTPKDIMEISTLLKA